MASAYRHPPQPLHLVRQQQQRLRPGPRYRRHYRHRRALWPQRRRPRGRHPSQLQDRRLHRWHRRWPEHRPPRRLKKVRTKLRIEGAPGGSVISHTSIFSVCIVSVRIVSVRVVSGWRKLERSSIRMQETDNIVLLLTGIVLRVSIVRVCVVSVRVISVRVVSG